MIITFQMANQSIRVVAAVVRNQGRYLITQRREQAVLPLLWEFPGGKVKAGESDEAALERELRERLDARATIGKKAGEKHHVYDGYEVTLVLYNATFDERRPLVAKKVKEFRWVLSSEFERYPFPAADQHTMDQLLGIKR